MSKKSKEEKLRVILDLAKENDVSANSIAQANNMGPYGVLKILKRQTKNPQTRTVDTLYKYMVDNYGKKSSDVVLSDYPPSTIINHIVKNLDQFEKEPTFDLFCTLIGKINNEHQLMEKLDDLADTINQKFTVKKAPPKA